jgi:hypothetical protein
MGLRRRELQETSIVGRVPSVTGSRADQHTIVAINAGAAPLDDDAVTVAGDITSLPATVTIRGAGLYDGVWAATRFAARKFSIQAAGAGGDVFNVGRWD